MGFGGGGVGVCQIKWPSREDIPKNKGKRGVTWNILVKLWNGIMF